MLEDRVLQTHAATIVPYALDIGYDYWPVEDVLKCILPEGLESVSSFETIGHIGKTLEIPCHACHAPLSSYPFHGTSSPSESNT